MKPWFFVASKITIPVDTRRKLNVNKTFNLRPVSTGISYTFPEYFNKIHQLDQRKIIFGNFLVFLYFLVTKN